MANNTLITTSLPIPKEYFPTIITGIQNQSVVASLATATPQTFADANHIVFSQDPLAEYVGEGENKSSSPVAVKSVPAKIHKLQTTVRMTNEVQWLDEDNRLALLTAIFEKMNRAMADGIDYGLLHGFNPLGGATTENLLAQAIVPNANQVTATGNIQADVDGLADSVLENYDVNGIALDRMYANELRKLRVETTGAKVYPEVGLTLNPGTLEGLRAVTSGNVSGKKLGVATNAQAIIGDWSQVKWGFVRNIGIKPIEFGDPDGNGDLQRNNQIAYRVEMVIAMAVLDPKAFAVLKAAA